MNPEAHITSELDLWEFQQLQEQLREWTFAGQHHMHKSWQFLNAQQALHWRSLALKLSDGHLARDDLGVTLMMNAMENCVKKPSTGAHS